MIRRARLFFFAALVVAGVILVANFPIRVLSQDRSTVRAESARLATLQATTRTLSSQVRALHDLATVAQIAHEEYGLVFPGEHSVVVLPSPVGTSASSSIPDPLADNPIPASDLLPSDAILGPGTTAVQVSAHAPGFWHRVVSSLEFWHSLF
jgi:cell division protein FtsB